MLRIEEQALARSKRSLHDTHQKHRPPVGIVLGIEDQGLQRTVGVACRTRQPFDDRLQYLFDALTGLGRTQHGVVGVEAEILLDLGFYPVDVGRRQIDFVDDRNDLEPCIHRDQEVSDGFGLDASAYMTEQGDANTYDINLSYGHNFANGRGNITIFGAYLDREELRSDERELSAVSWADPWFTPDAGELVEFGSPSVPEGMIQFPEVDYGNQGGLGEVMLHPDFATNGVIYLSYAEAGDGDTRGAAIARSTWAATPADTAT